jgi:hypothetical protein
VRSVAALAVLLLACAQPRARDTPKPWPATCRAIADDIERIRSEYPQLVEFRAATALRGDCTMSYEHHTHRATTRGGWSAGVPHPDPDGIWFYIGIYDPAGPEAMSQIHTQPVVPDWWIRDRKVMVLVLEGDQTKRAGQALLAILQRHGMAEKPR